MSASSSDSLASYACLAVSGETHPALEAWAWQFGPIARWGIEGSAIWGRHTAVFLASRGHDVRDACANRAPRAVGRASAGSPTP